MSDGLGSRLATGLAGGALVVALIFAVPPDVAFLVFFVAGSWAAGELIRIVRRLAPSAPLGLLWLWLPLAVVAGFWWLRRADAAAMPGPGFGAALALAAAPVLLGVASTLFGGCDTRDAAASMGLFAFAVPYFTAPLLSIYWLHRLDPWLLLLLAALVALGDTSAYFVGRALGRHKMAPSVSPGKSWEGAAGGFAAALVAAALWAWWRLGHVPVELLALAAATSVAAQVGDLAESAIKRAAGVKDSSQVLPGHGGFYDRLDATLLAAPVFAVGVWLTGPATLVP